LTSRSYDEITRKFRQIPHNLPTVRLPAENKNDKISAEINKVIQVKVSDISKELELEKNAEEKLKEKLMTMTHRTYLWLHLVLEEVCSSLEHTSKGIADIVDAIPESAEGAYEVLLNKNSKNPRKMRHARQILQLILAARRPLSLEELDVAFHIATEYPVSSYEELALDKQYLEDKIRNLCGLFIFIDHNRVYLIHQTAKEFLVAKGSFSEAAYTWKHSFEESTSEMIMTKACIHYLFLKDFDDTDAAEDEDPYDKFIYDRRGPKYNFMDYAATTWVSHFRNAKVDDNDPLLNSSLILCNRESERTQIWLKRFRGAIDLRLQRAVKLWLSPIGKRQGPANLHIAAFIGHEAVVKLLLRTEKMDINLKDNNGLTPLHWAAAFEQKEVVKLLLKNAEIDVNLKDSQGRTALHLAVATDDRETVKLLLDRGKIDVNLKGNSDKTARHFVVFTQESMLGNGNFRKIDMNFQNKIGKMALHWAVLRGKTEILKLLLDSGKIDVNFQNKRGETKLQWAALRGKTQILKLLLDKGKADVNLKDDEGYTALQWAARKNKREAVKLLEFSSLFQ
jgi:ankyrin repeat protein